MREAIAVTDEEPLYQTLRQDPGDYRFDGLPPGMYAVELRFAETQGKRPGQRLFDVIAETTALLTAVDIAYEVGGYAAWDHTAYLRVTDGQLNLRFVPRRGFGQPIVNAIRVTHRPDLE